MLETAVWEQVEELLTNQQLSSEILNAAKVIYKKQRKYSGFEEQKEKIRTVDLKLESLSERLTQIPKTVSAAPIFKQMEKLEALKQIEEQRLQSLPPTQGSRDLSAEFTDYTALLTGLRKLKDKNPEARQRIVEKLIHKIEVKPDGFMIHYHAGQQQLRKESEKSGSLKFIRFSGSNSLTNGDRGRT